VVQKLLIILLVLLVCALFVFVMESLPAAREWIALGVVMLMDGAMLAAFVRHRRQPARYPAPPLMGVLVLSVFSVFFYCVFLSYVANGR